MFWFFFNWCRCYLSAQLPPYPRHPQPQHPRIRPTLPSTTIHRLLLVPLTTSSVTISTRLQRTDFFASKQLTAISKTFGYNEHALITNSFFRILVLVVSATQCKWFQPIFNKNGVFLKWAELLGNLINHWSMNWAQFKDPVSHIRLAGTVVASWPLTQEVAGSSPFTVMNIFVTEFSKFSETFRKNSNAFQ